MEQGSGIARVVSPSRSGLVENGVVEYCGMGEMGNGVMEWWSNGVLGYWSNIGGLIGRKNKNRGYQQLRVWQDAITLYVETCHHFTSFPFEMKRVTGQAIASADSVHRNIAEGYCRKSVREYIQQLYVALGSLGESVSGYHAYLEANQLSKEHFEVLDRQAFKLENGLLRLVESLERKRDSGTWTETLSISESNAIYTAGNSDDS
jgi:four helix bundle protein